MPSHIAPLLKLRHKAIVVPIRPAVTSTPQVRVLLPFVVVLCDRVTGVTRSRHARELWRSWNVRLVHRLFPNSHRLSRPGQQRSSSCTPTISTRRPFEPLASYNAKGISFTCFSAVLSVFFFAFSATATVLHQSLKSRKYSTFLLAKIFTTPDSR